jgi:hypothetical protein
MGKINQIIARIGCFFVLLLALQIPGAALAHDGGARSELNNQQSSSGAELEIRGVNIAPEQPITLTLIGSGAEFSLGTAIGDEHGDFVIGVRLPAEALAGAYTVRAFGANRVVVAAPLTLVGSANVEGGERRDQSELMLEPIPHAQPAAPLVAAMPAVAAAPATPQQPQIALWPAIVLAALVAAAGLAIVARRRAASALK